MNIFAFDEVTKINGSMTVSEQPVCPFPGGPLNGTPNSQHYFSSNTPDDTDTCQCGRYYYEAVKTMLGIS